MVDTATPLVARLLYGSPAVLTIHGQANTASAVFVMNDFLDSASNARLLRGEGVSDIHTCFLTVMGGEPATSVLLIYLV